MRSGIPIEIDLEWDAAYVTLSKQRVAHTRVIADWPLVAMDLDSDGKPVGLEVVGFCADQSRDPEEAVLARLTSELREALREDSSSLTEGVAALKESIKEAQSILDELQARRGAPLQDQ